MSAEVETMAFFGELPWHKLGQKLDDEEAFDSLKVLAKSGLDWDVLKRPVHVLGESTDANALAAMEVPGHKALVRSTDGSILGMVSDRYAVIQNRDAFKVYDECAKAKLLRYETAISLYGGKRIVITATMPGEIKVHGDKSPIRKYLLLHTGHDGQHGCAMRRTPVRVVCRNTLDMALTGAADELHLRHTGNPAGELERVGKALAVMAQGFDLFEEKANFLARARYTDVMLDELTSKLFAQQAIDAALATPGGEAQAVVLSALAKASIEQVTSLFTTGKGHDSIRGTAWAALNAVAEFADHQRPVRGADSKQAHNRVASIFFGTAHTLKQNALDVITRQLQSA